MNTNFMKIDPTGSHDGKLSLLIGCDTGLRSFAVNLNERQI